MTGAARQQTEKTLRCGRFELALTRPLIMGIVNVTPDSFSDGGRYLAAEAAIAHAREQIAEGADILDIGGESTRPGAVPVDAKQELARVLPVIEALAGAAIPLSIDTMKADVIRAAIAAGVSVVNDVNALRGEGTLEACAQSDVAVCLMHMLGEPRTMQENPHYRDVVAEVKGFLAERSQAARQAGIEHERIVLDPGFGFGKTREHNLTLLRRLHEFSELGYPVLAGLSRKSVLGKITGQEVVARLPASVAAAVIAAQRGAHILRVHDVRATRDALAILRAVEGQA